MCQKLKQRQLGTFMDQLLLRGDPYSDYLSSYTLEQDIRLS